MWIPKFYWKQYKKQAFLWLSLCPDLWFIFFGIIHREQVSSPISLLPRGLVLLQLASEMRWLECAPAGPLTCYWTAARSALSGVGSEEFPRRIRYPREWDDRPFLAVLGPGCRDHEEGGLEGLCCEHWSQSSHHHSGISTLNQQLLFNVQFYSQRMRTKS